MGNVKSVELVHGAVETKSKLTTAERSDSHRKLRATFYHVTPIANTDSILRDGLKANLHGRIFVVDDLIVVNQIAKRQVFTDRYALFAVSSAGIRGPVLPDNVAEFTRAYQWIINQNVIRPKYLKLIGVYGTICDRPDNFDYLQYELMHKWSRAQTDDYFAVLTAKPEEITARFEAFKAKWRRKGPIASTTVS